MTTSPPPRNSQIQTKAEQDEVIIFWKKPGGGPFRYISIAVLIIWLCAWFAGFVSAVVGLLSDDGPKAFLAIWLACWTVGGVFAVALLYQFLRPAKPESVTIGPHRFRYDSGSAPLNFMNPYQMMRKKHNFMDPFSMMFRKRKMYEYARDECPEFVIEGLGDEQRLRFDDGADRVMIGELLKEPEREWLATILKEWRNG